MEATIGKQPSGRLLYPVLIVLAGLIAYSSSFSGAFVFDDEPYILDNAQIRAFPAEVSFLQLRSLLIQSLALNFALGAYEPLGYHVFNLAIHLLAGLVFYGLVRQILQRQPAGSTFHDRSDSLACAVALLWMVHPLQTQAVTYVIQRAEAMMALFYLVSLYCVVRGDSAGRWSWVWYLAALFATALGMVSKEVMVTAPLVILLFDRIYLASSFREQFARRGLMYLLLFSPLLLLTRVLPMLFEENPSRVGLVSGEHTTWEYLRTQAGVILYYLKLVVCPYPLCLDHGWHIAASATEIVLPGLIILALLAATLWGLWRQPKLGFLGLAFFLILAPTSSIVPVADLCVEHRMYLALAPLLVLLVLGVHQGLSKLASRFNWDDAGLRRRELLLVAATVVACSGLTILRNLDYQNPTTVWLRVLDVYPDQPRAHNNLAQALTDQQAYEAADVHYRQAIDLAPSVAFYRFGYAVMLSKTGRLEAAEAQVRAGLDLAPSDAHGHEILGTVLLRRGRIEDATVSLRQALHHQPTLEDARVHLGLALELQGQYDDAEAAFRQAIADHPFSLKAHRHLGNLLVDQGRPAQAVPLLQRLVESVPGDSEAHTDLARALLTAGQRQPARQEYAEAFRIQPNWPLAHAGLAWEIATGPTPGTSVRDAVRLAEEACQGTLERDPMLLDVLAAAYAAARRFPDAVRTGQQALALAQSAGLDEQARQIKQRLLLYKNNQAFHDPSLSRLPNRQ
ncbi:MAG: tetratricopeptide repeat protein [Gemmataceae bacterium]